jgi:general stress protein 26
MATAFPSEDTAKDAVRVWSIVQSIKTGMMSGCAGAVTNGLMDVRPMRGRFEDHPDAIWFIVPRGSIGDLELAGQEQLLTFSSGGDGEYVALVGKMSAVPDRAKLKSLWDAHADVEFPQGAEDPNATLMKFEPRTAQFWTHGGFLGFVVNFLEAKFTGEPKKIGEHGVVAP